MKTFDSSLGWMDLRIGWLLCLVMMPGWVLAQAPSAQSEYLDSLQILDDKSAYVVLEQVFVEGNRKTRRPNLLREMNLQVGDTVRLKEIKTQLSQQRLLLLNTSLFSEVVVLINEIDINSHTLSLRVVVREKWYIYPTVTVDLADRNFNVWWTEQGADLGRVNLGVRFKHRNLTGRADRAQLIIQSGYTRKAEFRYSIPYIDEAKLVGIDFEGLVDRNREWNVRTVDGEQDFFGLDTGIVLKRRRYRVGLNFRPGIWAIHRLSLERQVTGVDSVVASEINPNFLGNGLRRQAYFGLAYTFEYDHRDRRPFPMKGDYLELRVNKRGLRAQDDLNRLEFSLGYAHFQPLGSRLNLATEFKGKVDVQRSRVPYFNREALGFGRDFIRGYQYYIIDGLDYAYAKTTLRVRVLERNVKVPYSPVKLLKEVPARLYLGVHGDLGGARDPYNTPGNILANQVLKSYGFGLYANAFYGQVFTLEFSHNDLGDWGWYFGFSLGL